MTLKRKEQGKRKVDSMLNRLMDDNKTATNIRILDYLNFSKVLSCLVLLSVE